jgi:uncharacterized SAM-binding protein YcdF (DUF218 family)
VTRPRRATAFAALLILLLLAFPLGPRLGPWLVAEDPLEKADVIFVLGGTRMERPLEGADLYKAGWAPRLLLSRQLRDGGELELKARGISYPTEADMQRTILGGLGVPLEAIDILDDDQVSTSAEGRALVNRAMQSQWKRIIVVTSKMHTRRARLALRRQLTPLGITLIMRGSHYDSMDPEHWWHDRDDLRFTLFEYQKLGLYWLRIAD